MKKSYEPLEVEIIAFSAEDIVRTSGGDNETPEDDFGTGIWGAGIFGN